MGKRILIIDDSRVVHSLINHFVTMRYPDIKLTSTYNGKEALQLIERGERFDLILLDIMMPEMDGIEFLKHVKEKNINVKAPVVVCSEADRSLIEKALEMGAVDVMNKPFKNTDLYAILDRYVSQSS